SRRYRRCAPATDASREDGGQPLPRKARGRVVRVAARTAQRRQRSALVSEQQAETSRRGPTKPIRDAWQKCMGNRVIRHAPRVHALLETTARTTARPPRTPVGTAW